MEKGYYKPRKTLIDKPDVKTQQPKKINKNSEIKQQPRKETKTPFVEPIPKEKPNITGGYSKRVTYPENEVDPEGAGLQKGGGKIGGYIKPKTKSYNPMGKIIWVLLAIFLIAIIFAVLFFTNSLNQFGIGGARLGSQDLEMKISNVQIENDSIDLKIDINPGETDLVGIKIIVDDGYNFDVFKIELTKEEIEKGEIHLDLDKVDGDRITKILISPILNTEEREEIVGSVEESYIPKKTDFVSKRDINNYKDPQNKYYPYNGSSLKNQTQINNTQLNETLNNQIQNQTGLNQTTINQTNNETQNQTNYTSFNDPSCTNNNLSICYHESVYQFNVCSNLWQAKQGCTSEEVCITNECILREEVIPECGNGILEVGESCEEGTLAGETCEGFGYVSGTLICNPKCSFDLSLCLKPTSICTPNASSKCYNGDVYWYDSCDKPGKIKENCTSEQICEAGECIQKTVNQLCWFIENNDCISGDDTVACNRDLVYTSSEACEQNLIPSECFPLETNTYRCVKIQETDPGYAEIVGGASNCGPCINNNPGEIIQSEIDYYCKCPIPSGI